ncbi:MAG: nicotinate phosphoribosyltransferase [Candidatus Nezhaarchaeota archaeon]|nr:nicotinate phosphoribosyltransferase [Candidatus Nezhaarchaeota archaeon]
MLFFIAPEDDIKKGLTTDVYYLRTKEALIKRNRAEVNVAMDAHAYSLPEKYEWAVLAGVEEVARLLEGLNVDVYAMDEGTLFRLYEPVLRVEGPYGEFGIYETPILGILRHSSSIATKAARCKKAAKERTVISFGVRAIHPAIAPMADRAAFIGGCDAVAGISGAKLIGEEPVGTIPHELIIVMGDQVEAWKAFDEVMPPSIPRIALCDTWFDERTEALMAAQALGSRLFGVRFDTPKSRRGDVRRIVEETRWTLDLHGHHQVKIVLSAGLDEYSIAKLRDIVDVFGVGTSIMFPPSIDLAFDIVEVEGKPISKRGKMPGRKQAYRCFDCMEGALLPWGKPQPNCPKCSKPMEPLLKPLLKKGRLVRELPRPKEIRSYVLRQLASVPDVA